VTICFIIYTVTQDPLIHHRQSLRLKGYDYSLPGAYFVTICTREREAILGYIVNGDVRLNQFGRIVRAAWYDLPRHYPHIQLDTFCILPNHVHGIIILNDTDVGAGLTGQPIDPDGIPSAPAPLPDIDQTRPYGGPHKRHP
jgi:putative transposase